MLAPATPVAGRGATRPRARRRAGTLLVVPAVAAGLLLGGTLLGRDPSPSRTAVPTGPVVAASSRGRISDLEARVASDPDDAGTWAELGGRYVEEAVATADPAYAGLAHRALTEARRTGAPDAAVLLPEAVLALTLHDFAGAARLGTAAAAATPGAAEPLGVLVDAATELGRYDDAVAHLEAMLAIDPGAPALARLSYQRELRGDLTGAADAMAQALAAARATPQEATIAVLDGDLALLRRDVEHAERSYELASRLAPAAAGPVIGRARTATAAGDLDGARALLRSLLDRVPHADAARLLVELDVLAGDGPGAAAHGELVRAHLLLLEASGSTTDLEAARFEADHGGPGRALVLAQRTHDERATVFTADALAWALHRAGRTSDALPLIDDALALGTPDAALLVHAALVTDAAGDPGRSAGLLRAAFALSPWQAVGLRAPAAALADHLGVEVPSDWRT